MATPTGFLPMLHTLRSWPTELGDSSFLAALGLKSFEVNALGSGYQVQGVLQYLGGPVAELDVLGFALLNGGHTQRAIRYLRRDYD